MTMMDSAAGLMMFQAAAESKMILVYMVIVAVQSLGTTVATTVYQVPLSSFLSSFPLILSSRSPSLLSLFLLDPLPLIPLPLSPPFPLILLSIPLPSFP